MRPVEGVSMDVDSSAFEQGGRIPTRYTGDGEDIPPPLRFIDIPTGTVALALTLDDMDAPAGPLHHWLVWNLPPNISGIGEGEQVAVAGRNDFGEHGYRGPCPPSGVHTYWFKLYALDAELDLEQEAGHRRLQEAMQGRVIAHSSLTAAYSTQQKEKA